MKALVVYESMFGNTEQVAQAIAAGLGTQLEVEVGEVGDVPVDAAAHAELVLVGGPTHAFSMSRASTRQDAHRQGARHGSDSRGLREWLSELPTARDGAPVQRVAAFDTRVAKVRRLPGSAARKAERVTSRLGYGRAVRPTSFFVADTPGPLLDGELARAEAWGAELGRLVRTGH